MVRTVYYVAASLDGFLIDAQNQPGGMNPGEHSGGSGASLLGDHYREFLGRVGAVAMGAGTYRSFLADTASWPYGRIPVWIFTHHEFPGIPGADITFIRGEVAEFHPDIVYDAGEKDVLLAGGGNIARQFMDDGLIDEMVFTVVPVALGSGRPVLPVGSVTKAGVLLDTRSVGGGLVQLHYAFGPGEAFGAGESFGAEAESAEE